MISNGFKQPELQAVVLSRISKHPVLLKLTELQRNEKATPGMRESLFMYIVNDSGNIRIIIAENILPDGADQRKAERS